MSLRLDKNGVTVRCGVTGCGAEVGHISVGWEMLPDHTGAPPHLVLMPGYRLEADGVYRLTATATRRLRHGQSPRRRGRGHVTQHNRGTVPPENAGTMPCCMPVRVKCRCGWIHPGRNDDLGIPSNVVTNLHTSGTPHQPSFELYDA